MFSERTPHEEAGFTAEYGRETVRGESLGGRVAYTLQTAVKNGEQSALPPHAHNLMKRARVATTSSAMVELRYNMC